MNIDIEKRKRHLDVRKISVVNAITFTLITVLSFLCISDANAEAAGYIEEEYATPTNADVYAEESKTVVIKHAMISAEHFPEPDWQDELDGDFGNFRYTIHDSSGQLVAGKISSGGGVFEDGGIFTDPFIKGNVLPGPYYADGKYEWMFNKTQARQYISPIARTDGREIIKIETSKSDEYYTLYVYESDECLVGGNDDGITCNTNDDIFSARFRLQDLLYGPKTYKSEKYSDMEITLAALENDLSPKPLFDFGDGDTKSYKFADVNNDRKEDVLWITNKSIGRMHTNSYTNGIIHTRLSKEVESGKMDWEEGPTIDGFGNGNPSRYFISKINGGLAILYVCPRRGVRSKVTYDGINWLDGNVIEDFGNGDSSRYKIGKTANNGVVLFYIASSGEIRSIISTNGISWNEGTLLKGFGEGSPDRYRVVDANVDGNSDLVFISKSSSNKGGIHIRLSAFSNNTIYRWDEIDHVENYGIGEFDRYKVGQNDDGIVVYYLGGNRTVCSRIYSSSNGWIVGANIVNYGNTDFERSNSHQYYTGDVNGDGRADLLFMTAGKVFTRISNNNWKNWLVGGPYNFGQFSGNYKIIDTTGDGVSDVFYIGVPMLDLQHNKIHYSHSYLDMSMQNQPTIIKSYQVHAENSASGKILHSISGTLSSKNIENIASVEAILAYDTFSGFSMSTSSVELICHGLEEWRCSPRYILNLDEPGRFNYKFIIKVTDKTGITSSIMAKLNDFPDLSGGGESIGVTMLGNNMHIRGGQLMNNPSDITITMDGETVSCKGFIPASIPELDCLVAPPKKAGSYRIVVTLHSENGAREYSTLYYYKGEPPTINSAEVNILGDQIEISGRVTDPNSDISTLSAYYGSEQLICEGTYEYKCRLLNRYIDLAAGNNKVVIKVTDKEGGIAEKQVEIIIPDSPFLISAQNDTLGDKPEISGKAYDWGNDLSEIIATINVNGASTPLVCDGLEEWSCKYNGNDLPRGKYIITVAAKDRAGHASPPKTVEVTTPGTASINLEIKDIQTSTFHDPHGKKFFRVSVSLVGKRDNSSGLTATVYWHGTGDLHGSTRLDCRATYDSERNPIWMCSKFFYVQTNNLVLSRIEYQYRIADLPPFRRKMYIGSPSINGVGVNVSANKITVSGTSTSSNGYINIKTKLANDVKMFCPNHGFTAWDWSCSTAIPANFVPGQTYEIEVTASDIYKQSRTKTVSFVMPNMDQDNDGYKDVSFGGQDCNDLQASIHPHAQEVAYDGIDQNCDLKDLTDVDQDGIDAVSAGGTDCNDNDAAINPRAREIPYDGIDQNCDLKDLTDIDNDGIDAIEVGGTDCNDLSITIYPGANEIPYDGIDQNCDLKDLTDVDNDGIDAIEAGGTDCVDNNASIYPNATEIPYDGIDQNCDVLDLTDVDGDGYHATEVGGMDCNDNDASINPDAQEIEGDGIDQNCDFLMGYWNFDNESADDTSSNLRHGVIEGAIWDEYGVKNGSMYFDGESTISLGDSDFNIPENNEMTIVFWFKSEDASVGDLVGRHQYVRPYRVFLSADHIRSTIRTADGTHYLTGEGKIAEDEWHHCVLTYGNGKRTMYLDGVVDNTEDLSGTLEFPVGANTILGSGFIGNIDEVQIYNKALSEDAIDNLYQDITGYWDFNEGYGEELYDLSGNENNGVIDGATWIDDGIYGSALYFDGDDSVNLGNSDFEIADTNAFTISFWFSYEDTMEGHFIARDNYVRPFRVFSSAGRMRSTLRLASGTDYLTGEEQVTPEEWHYFVMTYGNGERKMYIDGVEDAANQISGELIFPDDSETIIGNGFIGTIDELKIRNRAMSAKEIATEYSQY